MTAHPARYSDVLLPEFQRIVDSVPFVNPLVLDPFAGTGRIHELTRCITTGIELEPEWAAMSDKTIQGDATQLPLAWTDRFDLVITSPTYGNRMADSHTPGPTDTSKRITYTHKLGRKLSPNNTGQMQWGARYKEMHLLAWLEAKRVLKPGGLFVLNCRDHYRKFKLIPVTGWHVRALETIGFVVTEQKFIPTQGMRFGANGDLRAGGEYVITFTLPNPKPYPERESA